MQLASRELACLKLTHQISLVFVLFATALVAGVGIMTYRSAEESLKAAATSELRALAMEKEASLNDLFDSHLDTLRFLAGSASIRRLLEQLAPPGTDGSAQNSDALQRLRSVLDETETFEALFVCQGGRVTLSSNPSANDALVPGELLLKKATLGPNIEIPEASGVASTKIWLAVPVLGENQRLIGVIAGVMRPKPLQEIAQRGTQAALHRDCFLVNKKGAAITPPVHPGEEAIGKSLATSEIVSLCVKGGSGELVGRDYSGVPSIMVYRWNPTREVGLILRVNLQEAIAPAHALGRRILSISAMALLIAVALAVAVGRGIARPLRRLQLGAAQFGRGEFDTRLSEEDSGEIGELSREFNRMAASISQMRGDLLQNAEELEKRVGERTGELAMSNFELAHEITERKRIEEELRFANEWADATNRDLAREIELRGLTTVELRAAKVAAESANRAKSEFLANMSHEIRTPMNGILGMTELLLDTPLSGQQREYLDIVGKSGAALLDIINDVLDCAKIESGKLELECIQFSLRELIFELLKPLGFEAGQKGLELVADLPGSVPDALMGDPIRLRQVLINLVGNAVKFTEQGEVVVTVRSDWNEEGKPLLRFSISDTGIGIAPEMQASVFAAFVQADGSTTRRFGGTGLGLAISSGLVDHMGGRLTLQSELGRGSCFEFSVAFEAGATLNGHSPSDVHEFHGMNVLIVDDSATNRRVVSELVLGWGMQPVHAETGLDALQRLRQAVDAGKPFDLVLLDADMPDTAWHTLAERILLHRPQTARAILLLSASVFLPDESGQIRNMGIQGVLYKPFGQMTLQKAIVGALGGSIEETKSTNGIPLTSRPLRILLAEDNPVNQHVAASFLSTRGHTVQVVADGLQAVAAAAQSEFDVILMDVQMPEMDGFEATARIRAHQQNTGRRIPIVALTARAMKGDEEKCLAGGMDSYISKPFARALLVSAVESAGSGHATRAKEEAV